MSVFVDTGAWFAYFVQRDPDHNAARGWVSSNKFPLVTSDYVLDELFTLLKIRESHKVAVAAGEVLTKRDDLPDSKSYPRRFQHCLARLHSI